MPVTVRDDIGRLLQDMCPNRTGNGDWVRVCAESVGCFVKTMKLIKKNLSR